VFLAKYTYLITKKFIFTTKIEEMCSTETSVSFYQTTPRTRPYPNTSVLISTVMMITELIYDKNYSVQIRTVVAN